MTESKLKIENLYKSFLLESGELKVLENINIDVKKGEFVSIVGYSGCGKSTLLRIIGGLEIQSSGKAFAGGQEISGPGLDRGMIFQESRLFPWLKVKDNILYGMSAKEKKKLSKTQKKEKVDSLLKLVGLESFSDVYPNQLSGGMQQRVSIARSLIGNPDILLLDEPFGALDAITRMNMQDEILNVWRDTEKTMLLVTHDIDEAIYLSDRIIVLSSRPGRVKKVFDVNLSRPRQRTSLSFSELRREIYKEFIEEKEPQPEYII